MQDDRQIATFVSRTNSSTEQAKFFLEACNGNLERALAMYQEQHIASPRARLRDPHIPPRPPPQLGPGAPSGPRNRRRGLFQMLFGVPVALLQTSLRVVYSAVNVAFNILNVLGSRLLPGPVMDGIRGLFALVLARGEEMDAHQAATMFVRQFGQKYGNTRPRWVDSSWMDATAMAHSAYKFLFVYLHAPQHQDSDNFCRYTLCNPEVVEYVNQTFVCWGGNVSYGDAYRLSSSLRVTRYPYVALLALSGANVRLVTYMEGPATAGQLLEVLVRAQEDHIGILLQEQVAAQERDWNRRLREEQDAEYQRSLEADRAREQQREEARRRAAEEQQRAAELQAKKEAEEAAIVRRGQELQANMQRRKQERKATLPAEPPADQPGCCSVRVRLPDGVNKARRFPAGATLGDVAHFVESLDELQALQFRMVNTFPRKEYDEGDFTKTLVDLGLAPMAALFVQPVTDD